jgi:membrane protein DedA with SNARE-associated domain
MTDVETTAVEAPDQPTPWWGPVAVVAWVVLVVLGYIGTAVAPRWANTNPEGLLMLHSRVRHLLLAAGGDISWWAYGVIGGLRLALAYLVCHLIGRAYGTQVLVWMGRFLGVRRDQMNQMIRMFHQSEWVVVPFFTGSNLVAAVTGITRTKVPRLVALVTVGIVLRLILWWVVAQVADDELDSVLDWLNRYQTPTLVVAIALTVLTVGVNLWRGRKFEL